MQLQDFFTSQMPSRSPSKQHQSTMQKVFNSKINLQIVTLQITVCTRTTKTKQCLPAGPMLSSDHELAE